MAGQKPAILRCNAVHLRLAAELVVGLAEDGLVEDIADALLLGFQAADVFVAGTQRHLVFDFETSHHHIDALFVQFGETHPAPDDVEVARVLHIVLVVGVVYNTLNITFVVTDNVCVLKNIFHALITRKHIKNC